MSDEGNDDAGVPPSDEAQGADFSPEMLEAERAGASDAADAVSADDAAPAEAGGLDMGLAESAGLDAGLAESAGLDAGLAESAGLDAGLAAGALAADDPSGGAPEGGLFADDGALDAMGEAGLRLSAEESEALLDAIRSGAAVAASENARKAELGSADEPMRRALRTADETLPQLEQALRDTMVRTGTTPAGLTHEACSVLTYESLTRALEPTDAVWLAHEDGERTPVAMVVLGSTLANTILERRLGAPDAIAGTRAVDRAPSSIERRVLEPVVRDVLTAGARAFVEGASSLKLGAYRAESEVLSHFAPCLRLVVHVALRNGSSADATVALFAGAFTPRRANAQAGTPMIDAVSTVEVDAVAVLGRCATTVRHLLSLEAGSVLRLDGAPDRPIEVRVDGALLMRGMPVVKDGNMAVEVRT